MAEVPGSGTWRLPAGALCISFPGLPSQSTTDWFKTSEIYSHTVVEPRSLKSRCQEGHALSETAQNPSLLLPSFWWEPAILGIPWLAAASLQSLLCLHTMLSPVLMSVSKFPSSYKDISHIGLRATSSMNSTWLHQQRPYFLIRSSHSQLPGVRASTCLSGGHNSIHNTHHDLGLRWDKHIASQQVLSWSPQYS